MPLYEYSCSSCGHTWEENRSIDDPPTQFCPRCRLKTAHRLISKSSFVLKGSGWARDGYTINSKGGKA